MQLAASRLHSFSCLVEELVISLKEGPKTSPPINYSLSRIRN